MQHVLLYSLKTSPENTVIRFSSVIRHNSIHTDPETAFAYRIVTNGHSDCTDEKNAHRITETLPRSTSLLDCNSMAGRTTIGAALRMFNGKSTSRRFTSDSDIEEQSESSDAGEETNIYDEQVNEPTGTKPVIYGTGASEPPRIEIKHPKEHRSDDEDEDENGGSDKRTTTKEDKNKDEKAKVKVQAEPSSSHKIAKNQQTEINDKKYVYVGQIVIVHNEDYKIEAADVFDTKKYACSKRSTRYVAGVFKLAKENNSKEKLCCFRYIKTEKTDAARFVRCLLFTVSCDDKKYTVKKAAGKHSDAGADEVEHDSDHDAHVEHKHKTQQNKKHEHSKEKHEKRKQVEDDSDNESDAGTSHNGKRKHQMQPASNGALPVIAFVFNEDGTINWRHV